MSANPNSVSNQIVFNLPVDFFTEEIEKKWMPVLKKNRTIYSNVADFINSTIKDITLPGLTFETSQQTIKRGKKIDWKSAQNINDVHVRQIDVKFKSVEAHLSYIILSDIIRNHYMDVTNTFVNPLTIFFIDRTSDLLLGVTFREIVFNSLSEMNLSYSDYDNAEKTFSMQFTFNFVDYDYIFELQDFETNKLDTSLEGRNGPDHIKLN